MRCIISARLTDADELLGIYYFPRPLDHLSEALRFQYQEPFKEQLWFESRHTAWARVHLVQG